MGMVDYLSRFPSAAAPETSHYDENFTVAKLKMINDALKPKDQLKPGGQKMNQIRKNPTVEGGRSCFYSKRKVVSNEIKRKVEFSNINRENTLSLEGVVTCNRRLTNQNRDICKIKLLLSERKNHGKYVIYEFPREKRFENTFRYC